MSDEVRVPYGDNAADTATLLLAAAEELDQQASVVTNRAGYGEFVTSEEVAKKAGVNYESDEDEAPADSSEEKPKAAKKTAAKKGS